MFASAPILDPDRRTLDFCASLLSGHAATIDYAATGRDALLQALDRPPDLVICEACLPADNGYDLCAMLRHGPQPPHAILLTPAVDAVAQARAAAAGVDLVLQKPLTATRFLAALQELETRIRTACDHAETLNQEAQILIDEARQIARQSRKLRREKP